MSLSLLGFREAGVCLLALACSPLIGCASQQQDAKHAHQIGISTEDEVAHEDDDAPALPAQPEAPAETVVQEAARPFSGYRPVDQQNFSEEEFLTTLASADAICIGERHDQPLDHYAQLRALDGLLERRALRGFELGLALEMVTKEAQPVLTAYQEGSLSDEEFEVDSRWAQQWGFPIQYYRPQLSLAVKDGAKLLGLGVDRELTKQIAKGGYEALDEVQLSRLPNIDEKNAAHRRLFDSLMAGHPHTEGQSLDNYYAAQLVWDESMARRSAEWLSARAPSRKLVIFAGTAHCHRTAIPSRIERRERFVVVNVLPVAGGQPLEAEGEHKELVSGYDYQMVFER